MYSNSIKELAKRGIRLEILGFVLNICRYTVPYLIGYAFTANTEKYIEPLLYRTLCNDILQFAGIALLLMAFLRWLKISDNLMLFVGLGMSLLGMLFNGIDVNNPLGNIFLGYFVGTEDAAGRVFSYFPLLNWFLVPVSGYLFGKLLIRVKDKDKFYLMLSPAALLATVVYFTINIQTGRGMFGEGQNCYYHIQTGDVLISIIAAVGLLGFYYCLSKWIPKFAMNVIKIISRNVTHVYCIHWVIITFSINVCMYVVRGTQELSVFVTLLLSFVISITAICISHIFSAKAGKKVGERGK